ncbi:MAG: M20 family metallopeptidase [Lentihominibacter sp.]|jgi:glutamate carboxypeptidase
MKDFEMLVNYIDEHFEDMMVSLEQIVLLETPSLEDKSVSDKCSKALKKLFEDTGFEVETIPQQSCGDCVVARIGFGDKGTLCVGHYDTVFPIGYIERNPFRITEKKAYGPGILDMKGGIIMGLYAVKALQDLDLMPEKRITFFLNSDEESGSFFSRELIEKEAAKHNNVIILEPGYDEIGSIKLSRFGRATYNIIAHGKAAHSGSNPEQGINPLEELSQQLLKLKEINNLENGITLASTYFNGGIPNTCVVPETATLAIDVRAKSKELLETANSKIKSLPPILAGIWLEIQGGIDKPPLPEYTELLDQATIYAKELGIELKPQVCRGGSDGNFTGGMGVPTIDGLGMSGLLLHTDEEYINLDHIPKRTALVAQLIRHL